jgi:hypothetical protein
MQPDEKKYWFRAKRYGWGWGLPCAWQGWAVFTAWLLLVVGGAFLFGEHPCIFFPSLLILSAALIAVCWIKGERPRWRWGND